MKKKQGLMLLVSAVLCNAGANVLIRKGMLSRCGFISGDLWGTLGNIFFNPMVVAGFVLFVLTFLLYSRALVTLDLSYAYPLLTGGALFCILLFSVFLLEESLSLGRRLGMALILVGVTVVSVKG